MKNYKNNRNEIGISSKNEEYIQLLVQKKIYISFDCRCGIDDHNEVDALVSKIEEISTEVKPVIS